jgi:hypothetical protein
MKKIIVAMMGMLTGMALTASAQGPNLTLDFTINVSVASDPINLQGVTEAVSFGVVGFNTTNLSNNAGGQPRSTVNNAGYASVDYTARAEITMGDWTLGTTPGNNTAVLYGIFTQAVTPADDAQAGRNVAVADFSSEDRLINGVVTRATDTILAQNSEDGVEIKGNNVATTQSFRSLRYRLDTPTGGDMNPQTITITIGAVAL